ncbi:MULTISPECIES: hydrolase [Francisella]|uniref:Hydrolase n=1 Tax=Francisella opportunistica TaxID=2016517 RepID=A0A345JP89_9GAMM|nr:MULTISPECIES: hydrolase [Francisella]APC90794.1 Allophanate hydrolase 2 subunit 2 [Francisella sp. MA067296]AXH29135.1 hydrolase [Francisella opportunistica]
MQDIFSTKGGLVFAVSLRQYGSQDKGISPQGAQDQLSFITAYNLVGKPSNFQAIEMIYPAEITANQDALVCLCGASYEETYIDAHEKVSYNQVFVLGKGQKLEFKGIKKGFRTLVFAVRAEPQIQSLVAKTRLPQLTSYISETYSNNLIRVLKGPEYNILKNNSFFENSWTISANSSQMGLSLDGVALATQKIEMISQPVTDGTIQLAPSGPIVLMRHRQTVGGYPRIANVIAADINKLSQFAPNAKIKFKLVSLDEAVRENTRVKQLID